ncbi:GIY-YIG nuclease family protein [Lysobacter maris]|uniref:GIY-YIG nuclease family protein n=2 Tax=Marilutibacter maris TaxID=1605891 RepID=A0A508AUB3_9GAMM|nr:GIY-YIG nuclease family protein [Lysobacter maris]
MVMRHRPTEKALRDALPTLAAERHEIYNAYQCQHGETVENALAKASHLVSFIGHQAGRAMFIGLYEVAGFKRIDVKQYWRMPGNAELRALGTRGPKDWRSPLWFDLQLQPELAELKGRLVVTWPGIERSWWRWASRNHFAVHCIHEESRLLRPMPAWNELVLGWTDLKLLPESWRQALSHWRGVYYIFDTSLKQGYVGSASGSENLLGRWKGYAVSGHGGNRLLKRCNPEHFVFSILERVSPDMDVAEVVAIENLWKQRLHTRAPQGLNDN